MNTFNRIVMALAILFLMVAVVGLVLSPLDAVSVARLGVDAFEQSLFVAESYNTFLIASGVALFLLLVLLVLELRRPRRRMVRIKTQGRGNAQLNVESVTQSLEYRVDELAGVRQVRTHVSSRGNDVDVALDLDTSPSVNIPALTEQVVALAHDIVEGQLGLKVHGQVRVNIKHEPYPRGAMPVRSAPEREAGPRSTPVEPVSERAPEPTNRPVVVSATSQAPVVASTPSNEDGDRSEGDAEEAPKRAAW
mgnify:CR=1 FL=1